MTMVRQWEKRRRHDEDYEKNRLLSTREYCLAEMRESEHVLQVPGYYM